MLIVSNNIGLYFRILIVVFKTFETSMFNQCIIEVCILGIC